MMYLNFFLFFIFLVFTRIFAKPNTESVPVTSPPITFSNEPIKPTELSNKLLNLNESNKVNTSDESDHLHVHKIALISHGDHIHRIHHIHLLPAMLTNRKQNEPLIKEEDKKFKEGESSNENIKSSFSGKCNCDVLLVNSMHFQRREHLHNVYDNQLNLTSCDLNDQKQCQDFCINKANRFKDSLAGVDEKSGKSDGQLMCSTLSKDVEKQKLALFATVECEGKSAGFLSFKKITKWTGLVYPMQLSCKNGTHQIEPIENEAKEKNLTNTKNEKLEEPIASASDQIPTNIKPLADQKQSDGIETKTSVTIGDKKEIKEERKDKEINNKNKDEIKELKLEGKKEEMQNLKEEIDNNSCPSNTQNSNKIEKVTIATV